MSKIYCPTLEKYFDDKLSMHLALKTSEKDILARKCGQEFKSFDKGQLSSFNVDNRVEIAEKSGFKMEDGYVYPIANTTLYMDSHMDVHDNGLWDKSIKENKDGIYYLDSHNFGLKNTIAYPKDVQVFTKTVDWAFLGMPYEGKTQALVGKIAKDAIRNQEAKYVIENKIPMQNSVRMIYIKVQFAANSDHKDLQEANKIYHEKIDSIANKDIVNEYGYFYLVKEARLFREFSMVSYGSNDATPIMQKTEEADVITSEKIEPQISTQQKTLSIYDMMTIVNKKIIN